MPSITAANSIITLAVDGVFPAPVQISGFAADDIFDVESQKKVEVLMGVDGNLSGGFVHVPLVWMITLQADSESNLLFDAWDDAQTAAGDTFIASGDIVLPSIGFTMALKRGFLTD